MSRRANQYPGQSFSTRERPPALSIRDVARFAGVSYQTVSRVINESPSVKPSTREAVLSAISELGFRPNRAARALRGGPVQSVTVIASSTTLYGFAASIEGVEEAAREARFGMGVRVLESSRASDVLEAMDHARELGGALIIIAFDEPGVAALKAAPREVPVVAMVQPPLRGEAPPRTAVWIDEYDAAKKATLYLLELGHETVHHISIPSWKGTTRRRLGWEAALKASGVALPPVLESGWGAEWGYRACRQLLDVGGVTAVLCGNDDIAVGAMRAVNEAGLQVPRDMSLVGFDDVPLARFYSPALTTVRQDFKALGKACFARLLSLLDPARSVDQPPVREPELVVRESAGPPPSLRRTAAQRGGPNAKRKR